MYMVNVFLACPTGKFLGQKLLFRVRARVRVEFNSTGMLAVKTCNVSFCQQGTGVCSHMME